MKSRFVLICILLTTTLPICGQVVRDSLWHDNIRTATLTKNDIEMEPPVLRMNSSDFLMLRFDLLGEQPELFRYRIQHCNAAWHIDNLEPMEYISGFEDAPIEEHQFSQTTLQPYVNYYQRIPSPYTTFIASGNYLLSVYLQDHPDSVVLTQRFYVTEELLEIELSVDKPTSNARIQQDQELTALIGANSANSHLLVPQYLKVVAMQNGRLDNLRTLPFGGYVAGKLGYRWQKENQFEGGNDFRYFDVSNIRMPMYNIVRIERFDAFQPEGSKCSPWFAFVQPEEDRSKRHYSHTETLNGGMKVNVWDRNRKQIEADYVWVNFTLPMAYPYMNGNIYIVGDLTQWELSDKSRMEWNPRQKAYTHRLYLKQGYYAYQLLFVPVGESSGCTATLEGDHYQTPNNYTLLVYYTYPNDRYDRLLSVKRR